MQLEGQHIAVHIANVLQSVIDQWRLTNKVVCVVTDNAVNMIAACRQLAISHIGCFAHTLNLVVQDGLNKTENLEDVLRKCKNVVAFFNRSNLTSDHLKREQEERNQPKLKLLQDVATRWNSVYYIIKRILTIGDCLTITHLNIPNASNILSIDHKNILSDIMTILDIFENAPQQISGNYVTISLIIGIITGIYHNLNELRGKIKTTIGLHFLQIMHSMNTRLIPYESKFISKIATLLDHKLAFKNKDNALSAQAEIQKEAQACFTSNPEFDQTHQEPQPSTSKIKN